MQPFSFPELHWMKCNYPGPNMKYLYLQEPMRKEILCIINPNYEVPDS